MLYDSDCPFCMLEVKAMRRLNRKGHLGLVDIAAPDFDPSEYGRTLDELMGTIHGVRGDGTLVTGMATFREAYAVLGLGWLWAPTGWPVLRPLFDWGYRLFARHRIRLGRVFGRSCDTQNCRIPLPETQEVHDNERNDHR